MAVDFQDFVFYGGGVKRAYSYIRFSRLHQADGDSERRQKENTEAYCARNGLVLDDSLELEDFGISAHKGRNIEKGALGRFITACEEGGVPRGSALVVESLDRLSRQSPRKTVGLLTRLLDEHGIEVHLTMVGKVFLPESEDGVDLIFAVALAMRAHDESETKSRRLVEAFAKKRKAAAEGTDRVSTSLPWWLEWKGDKIVAPAPRVKILREIFTRTAAGESSNKIAWDFNERKVPTWGRKRPIWLDSRIREVVRSNAPCGTISATAKTLAAGKTWSIENYYPALISKELAAEARATLVANRRTGRPHGTGPANLLKGIGRYKGIWLRFDVRKKPTFWNCYYVALNPDKPGIAFNVSGNQVEAILLAAISELGPEALAPVAKEPRSVALQKKIEGMEKRIENLGIAVEAGSVSLAPRLVELEGEHATALRELEELHAEERAPGVDPAALKSLSKFSPADLKDFEERKQIAGAIRRLITRIDIGTELGDLPIPVKTRGAIILRLAAGPLKTIPDPTNTRGKKPLAMLVTFRGGANRLIARDEAKWQGILSERVEPGRTSDSERRSFEDLLRGDGRP